MQYSKEDIEDLIDGFKYTEGVELDSKTYVGKHPYESPMLRWWRPCILVQDHSFAKLDLHPNEDEVYARASAMFWQRIQQHFDISQGLSFKASVNSCEFWMNMRVAPHANFVEAFNLYEQHAELVAVDEQHQLLIGVMTEDPTEHQEQLWLFLLRYQLDEQGQPHFEQLAPVDNTQQYHGYE
ncbi:hypothetical protein L9G74_01690 [Shewanella sp. C32]|uniref:Uncharacterized protein n=1 Tax=Shewanella electrica TaxID=515560 RepID=A0ABT2FGT7_9GAMM|nr:hypothetical protein [Shewanella electrica]MCH1925316.1 hypothetical protein [Shewanella electrica]MCS4555141.1 hypothetical protein [Shewanella electrica]